MLTNYIGQLPDQAGKARFEFDWKLANVKAFALNIRHEQIAFYALFEQDEWLRKRQAPPEYEGYSLGITNI